MTTTPSTWLGLLRQLLGGRPGTADARAEAEAAAVEANAAAFAASLCTRVGRSGQDHGDIGKEEDALLGELAEVLAAMWRDHAGGQTHRAAAASIRAASLAFALAVRLGIDAELADPRIRRKWPRDGED